MKKNAPAFHKRLLIRRIQVAAVSMCGIAACILIGAVLAKGILLRTDIFPRATPSEASAAQTSVITSTVLTSAALTSDTGTPTTVTSTDASATTTSANTISTTDDTTATTQETTAATKETTEPTASTVKQTQPDGSAPDLTGYVVVLDPGHQLHANYDQESIGPGMEGTKAKCSSGTAGVSTGRPEYEVNLEIALKMRDYLQSLGCEVYMTRTTNDVDISNIERANFALSYSPDVYLRLHCNGSDNSSARGSSVYVADTGKYTDSLEDWGDLLGSCLSDATGTKYRGCYASSVYSGLNWAADIPSFLLEMGFMSNATDDELLSDPDFQQLICEGAAEFISMMPKS